MPGTESTQEKSAAPTRRPPRVVIAEDDADARMALADALASDGCIVIEARDGDELLNLLIDGAVDNTQPRPYDAIITDIVMPGFSGIDVLTALRRSTAFIPVIIVTGHVDESTIRAAERLNVVALFRKPVEMDEVRDVLARSLEPSFGKSKPASDGQRRPRIFRR